MVRKFVEENVGSCKNDVDFSLGGKGNLKTAMQWADIGSQDENNGRGLVVYDC